MTPEQKVLFASWINRRSKGKWLAQSSYAKDDTEINSTLTRPGDRLWRGRKVESKPPSRDSEDDGQRQSKVSITKQDLFWYLNSQKFSVSRDVVLAHVFSESL